MRVKINEDELYDVRFKTKCREHKRRGIKNLLHDSFCAISIVDESKKGAEQYERVSEAKLLLNDIDIDIYDKWAGRKKVFSRAITSFNKEDRVIFWKIYRKTVGEKRFNVFSIRDVIKKEEKIKV